MTVSVLVPPCQRLSTLRLPERLDGNVLHQKVSFLLSVKQMSLLKKIMIVATEVLRRVTGKTKIRGVILVQS